ncbi:HAD family hydrolase [Paenibacillus allorhizosphaerae]|uniref:Pyrimidine 5'-nucleotidase YjjG n=1 Tax=Paenibacillus allorhizosphaerae TaxID=2849866 RepID=A0ABM8VHQ1_9BACL|nr:HAD family hydrolase [Paenibacillus allorhizosphaerae]CAG7642387.1 Pyrimidine 5'-nucleotidase YjjG [Paenibacillus allorhizosphaerae]
MHSVKVVVFDLDDTLIHFDDYWEESLLETLRRHPATKEYDPKRLFGVLSEMNQIFEDQYHRQQITLRQFRNYRLMHAMSRVGEEMAEQTAEHFNMLHMDISKRYMKASPELLELLKELHGTYKLGIVTNGTSRWQRDKLEALGIQTLFEPGAVFISDEVGFEKPSSEIYRKALHYFGVKPEEVLFVGDSWNNDVIGPMRAGMRSIWYNKKMASVPEGATPFGMISDMAELRQYLRQAADPKGVSE